MVPCARHRCIHRQARLSYWQWRAARHLMIGFSASCTARFWNLLRASRPHLSPRHCPRLSGAVPHRSSDRAGTVERDPRPRQSRQLQFEARHRNWAGILALAHTGIGLDVHLRGRPGLYFIDEHHRIRHELFGFGNDTGLIAALLFLLWLAYPTISRCAASAQEDGCPCDAGPASR